VVPLLQILQLSLDSAHKVLNSYLVPDDQHFIAMPECKYVECKDETLAPDLDGDDFEFEPIKLGSAGNLVHEMHGEVEVVQCDWVSMISKVEHILDSLSYTRLASCWVSHQVSDLILKLLQRMESHPAAHTCVGAVSRMILLLRDRMMDAPQESPNIIAPLLAIIRPSANSWSVAAGLASPSLALIACFAASGSPTGDVASGILDCWPATIRRTRAVWEDNSGRALDVLAAHAEGWEAIGAVGDRDGDAEACLVAQSVAAGAPDAGSSLLRSGFVRQLALRILSQATQASPNHLSTMEST
jgi:hypothetical protein